MYIYIFTYIEIYTVFNIGCNLIHGIVHRTGDIHCSKHDSQDTHCVMHYMILHTGNVQMYSKARAILSNSLMESSKMRHLATQSYLFVQLSLKLWIKQVSFNLQDSLNYIGVKIGAVFIYIENTFVTLGDRKNGLCQSEYYQLSRERLKWGPVSEEELGEPGFL